MRQRLAELRTTTKNTIYAMALIVEIRDSQTGTHQHRVANLASMIAKHMNLTEKETVGTYLASIIHDVGRTYIPIEIVNKPGRLTHTEFSIVKMHPRVGYDILGMVEFSWPIAEIILQHHERMDGFPYHSNPKGAVPLGYSPLVNFFLRAASLRRKDHYPMIPVFPKKD